jgi:4-hydroxybenzoyl-CoA thioesterase
MASNSRTLRIEWGDCDPAGIVFHPRYFAMFDHSTTLLIERALGMSKHQLQEAHPLIGYPMVESRARFLKPAATATRSQSKAGSWPCAARALTSPTG